MRRSITSKKILFILKSNGLIHSLKLLYIYLVLPIIMKVLPFIFLNYIRLYRMIKNLKRRYNWDKEKHYWQLNKEKVLELGRKGYRLKIDEIGLELGKLKLIRKRQQLLNEVVIADIDQDGYLLSHFGPMKDVATISEDKFLARKRFNLKVIVINGFVGIKKYYNGNKIAFLNEIEALHQFGIAGCNVPAIMDFDLENLTLTFSYILGPVLREELAKRGAKIRDRDTNLSNLERIQESKCVLYDVIDSQFVENLFDELRKIHATGFILKDLKYGNIISELKSGKPYLIDFDYTYNHSNIGTFFFRILRDEDIEKFDVLFDRRKLTYKRIRERIKKDNMLSFNEWYAPVYFTAGLRIGLLWSLEAGYGRWHYILKHNIPSLSGKRVLDLGTNNAFNSIMMLRNGASEVVGIERESKHINQGHFVKEVFEWTDNTQYNFKYIKADFKDIPTMNLGNFDIVSALCSIYYLDDDSIDNLIQYISTITDTFLIQCNNDTNLKRKYSQTYIKASVEYNINALKRKGFPHVQVINRYGYHRPLLIGRKN